MDWRRAPAQWGAIHFHDDDLYDAGWRPEPHHHHPGRARAAACTRCGCRPRAAPTSGWCSTCAPPRRGPRAPVAFLASTATYLAYSNYRARMRPGPAELFIGALPIVDPTDLLLMYHPELGGSTYDSHSDGSGVCHVSRPAADRQRPADRLAVEPVPRFLSARLAGSPRPALRRHHRRRSARRGPVAARGLSRRPHRLSSRVLLAADAGRARRPTSGAAGGSCTWAATASTGGCRIPPRTPG